MILTWELTGHVALYAAILSVLGLGYLKWLAWDFDRKYGKDASNPPAE